jgi:hypothetical protein
LKSNYLYIFFYPFDTIRKKGFYPAGGYIWHLRKTNLLNIKVLRNVLKKQKRAAQLSTSGERPEAGRKGAESQTREGQTLGGKTGGQHGGQHGRHGKR